MAENSGIEWTHHTFNPWIGCTKISPACDHCYAAEWDKRYEGGKHWGAKAPRRRTSASNWRNPVKWDLRAEKEGTRYRVFCASLADVFDNKVPEEWRADLFKMIAVTPNLDWLLLTKRPQNIKKFLPDDWGVHGYPNVWLGMTAENQEEFDKRIGGLLDVPAAVHFLSCEPLLGDIQLGHFAYGIDWIITGGESGSHFRSANPDWFRSLRDQCAQHKIPFLFKQWEGKTQQEIKKLGRELDGKVWDEYPK
jgi:protein gp37